MTVSIFHTPFYGICLCSEQKWKSHIGMYIHICVHIFMWSQSTQHRCIHIHIIYRHDILIWRVPFYDMKPSVSWIYQRLQRMWMHIKIIIRIDQFNLQIPFKSTVWLCTGWLVSALKYPCNNWRVYVDVSHLKMAIRVLCWIEWIMDVLYELYPIKYAHVLQRWITVPGWLRK